MPPIALVSRWTPKTRHATILPPLQPLEPGIRDAHHGPPLGPSPARRHYPTPLLQEPLERLKRLPKTQRKDAMPMLEGSLNPSGR